VLDFAPLNLLNLFTGVNMRLRIARLGKKTESASLDGTQKRNLFQSHLGSADSIGAWTLGVDYFGEFAQNLKLTWQVASVALHLAADGTRP
jgi:hypothetical protein